MVHHIGEDMNMLTRGMMKLNNVISLSGGKDSTAVLLLMLENNEAVHSVVFFDTGWEFPAMYDHLDKLEKYTGVKIWRLRSRIPFDYLMTERPVVAKNGENKGKVHYVGYGWPSSMRRWCTREKVNALDSFSKPIPNRMTCIGYATDETKRIDMDECESHRFPLVEQGMTEADALKYCYEHGFDWGGLYEHFNRVSCFCCPLTPLSSLRTLRKEFPDLWSRMLEMDSLIKRVPGMMMESAPDHKFKGGRSVHDLDRRFYKEDASPLLDQEPYKTTHSET